MIDRPQILVGQVMHRRTRPSENAFTYPTVFLRLPLNAIASDEQSSALNSGWFGINRFSLLSFHTADHANRAPSVDAMLSWVKSTLTDQGLDALRATAGGVVLMTYPRLLGYVFNPVSFWYCYDSSKQLRVVIAEVNNTFGERHNYVVAHRDNAPISDGDRITATKVFHVSPFCDVCGEYRFSFRLSDEHAHAVVNYHDEGSLLIATSISGEAKPLTAENARRAFFATPLMTLGVVARIHWQALKLLFKRVQFFSKPEPPTQETTR
jgi:uncharacterized protein